MLTSIASAVLALAILAFVALVSGVLLWDGLAVELHGHGAAVGRQTRLARLRIAVGAIGFAIAAWVALGLLTHAH